MSAIYVKDLLLPNADFQQIGNDFTTGANLTSLLSSVNLQTSASHRIHVKLQLTEPGDYYITKMLFINCDFTIEGCKNTRIIANFPNQAAYQDDCFIHFSNFNNNRSYYSRFKTIIKNIIFDVHSNHHWKTQEDGVTPAELYYLKVYYPQSLLLDNVKMSLSNHPITNIDIRNGQNILIENCVLENYHDNINVSVGGNLWLRAITNNVKIINNIFKKTGNDEALAFFGHHTDDNYILPADDIPSDGFCRKQNIIVSNNIFEYGEPGTTVASIINDCLITLIDLTSNQSQTLKHVYDNISFEGNTIIMNDLTKRVFSSMNIGNTKIRNVYFVNNNIKINGFTASSAFCEIFVFDNQSNGVNSIYHVKGNKVFNQAKITDGNNTMLYFLLQNGGIVSVLDNYLKIYEDNNDTTQEQRRFNFFWINKRDSSISIENNYIEGCHMLGSISHSTSSGDEAINYAKVLIKNNYIKGGSSIYTNNIGWFVLNIEDNYIESDQYVIALQNYGNSGNFCYINNHVVSKFSGTPTFYYSNSGCNASRVCISNNVFENATSSILTILNNYVSSSNRKELYNIYLN